MKEKIKKIFKSVYKWFWKILEKIPLLVWGTFASIGIFLVGTLFGYMFATNSLDGLDYSDLSEQNTHYKELIYGYEDLSDLYYRQGENVGVVMDRDMWEQNPEEISDAFSSMDEYRTYILLQEGRIMQLRKNANLPEFPENFDSMFQ